MGWRAPYSDLARGGWSALNGARSCCSACLAWAGRSARCRLGWPPGSACPVMCPGYWMISCSVIDLEDRAPKSCPPEFRRRVLALVEARPDRRPGRGRARDQRPGDLLLAPSVSGRFWSAAGHEQYRACRVGGCAQADRAAGGGTSDSPLGELLGDAVVSKGGSRSSR